MIRRSILNIMYTNPQKREKLLLFMHSYSNCVRSFIDLFWEQQRFSGRFLTKETLDLIPSFTPAATRQSAAQQALQIVKTQRKKRKKTKPTFSGKSITLSSNFIDLQEGNNSFDFWLKMKGFGDKSLLFLPTRKHRHFNQLKEEGWSLKRSLRLRVDSKDRLFVDVFFEKEAPKIKETGKDVGLDSGYKKLLVSSTGKKYGTELPKYIDKIAKKKQGSLAFKRALIERDEYINREIKKIPWSTTRTLIVEDLKNVMAGSRCRSSKQFNNKLQRWVYSYTLNRLSMHAERSGVRFVRVPPQYTSQKCNHCGYTHKENRQGEIFLCRSCGYKGDADYNASRNILSLFSSQGPTDPGRKKCSSKEIDGLSKTRTIRDRA